MRTRTGGRRRRAGRCIRNRRLTATRRRRRRIRGRRCSRGVRCVGGNRRRCVVVRRRHGLVGGRLFRATWICGSCVCGRLFRTARSGEHLDLAPLALTLRESHGDACRKQHDRNRRLQHHRHRLLLSVGRHKRHPRKSYHAFAERAFTASAQCDGTSGVPLRAHPHPQQCDRDDR